MTRKVTNLVKRQISRLQVYSAWNANVNILHRNKSFFPILDSRYYGVKNGDAGEHPTITVTEYEGDKLQSKIVPGPAVSSPTATREIIQQIIERFYDYHQD